MYSIKAVSQATGLTAETLRAWERRYGIVAPQRDASGRRVYTSEDVMRLGRLGEATRRGHPISRLAALDDAALAALVATTPASRSTTTRHEVVDRILDAAARFEPAECDHALALACTLLPAKVLVADVLAPLVAQVGERRHRGELTVAQERLVSGAVHRYAGIVLQSFARLAQREPIVFATLPAERNELALLMTAVICAGRGHRVHHLGTEMPPVEIARYAGAVAARVIALSVVSSERVAATTRDLGTLARGLSADVGIWISGAAAREVTRDALPAACVLIADESELERRLDLLEAA
jgi:DNA-binding transcriptional MerR regulator